MKEVMKIFQDTFYEIIFTQKNYFLHNKFKYIYIYSKYFKDLFKILRKKNY